MLKCKIWSKSSYQRLQNGSPVTYSSPTTLIQSSQDISEAIFSEGVTPYLQCLLQAILMTSHYCNVVCPCTVSFPFFNKFPMIRFIFIMKSRALNALPCLRPMSTPNCSGLSPSTPVVSLYVSSTRLACVSPTFIHVKTTNENYLETVSNDISRSTKSDMIF